jgi:hypothetical protein
MASDPTATDWISAISAAVQTLAVVVAGVFAYYKFLRGRTFAYRAELDATAELVKLSAADALRVHATLKNTGPSKIPLRTTRLRVFGGDNKGSTIQWKRLTTVDVFAEHHWIESQETISDEVLIPLPPPDTPRPRACRVEFVLFTSRRRLWRPWKTRVIRWSTERVALEDEAADTSSTSTQAKGAIVMSGDKDRYSQRESDEDERKRLEQEDALERQRRGTEEEIEETEREE